MLPSAGDAQAAASSSTAKTSVPNKPDADADFPALREDWFRAGRVSHSAIPAASLRLNAARTKMQFESKWRSRSSAGTLQWNEIGPRPQVDAQYGNLAGRVTAIAVDTGRDPSGNTVYVGTAYGGLWKSSNGLSANPTFTPITENAPTLSVGAIALDASTNPTTIYVGTGEPDSSIDSYYGVGIMKSSDGGVTWSTVSTADNGMESFYGQAFSKILIDPNYPQMLVACTRLSGTPTYRNLTSGIFRSVDYGQTWTMVYPATNGCSDLAYQASTNTYFAALRGVGIMVSRQGGAGWVAATTPFPSQVPPSLANMQRVALATRNAELWALVVDANGDLSTPVPCTGANAGCDSGLSVSNDGGHTWTGVPAPANAFGASSQGWYDVYIGAPGNNGAVVLGGIDLWRGQWNGTTSINWSNLTNGYNSGTVHPDQHAFASLDDAHWYIGNDGGLWTTANAGQQWTNANASIGAIQFTSVSADPFLAGAYFGGSQDNGTAANQSSSFAWSTIYPGDGGFTLPSTQTPALYFTENYSVSLRRSNDRGATFSTVVDSSTISDFSGFYVPYVFSDATEASLLLGTCRLWRGPANASNGTGWQPISGDLSNNSCGSYITAIATAPTSPDTVYAVTRNSLIWQASNATSATPTWTSINGYNLPQRPFSGIAVDPTNANNVYLTVQGFDTGHVFRYINGSWIDISQNLPNIPANAVVIDPQQPLNIYVATDAGVYLASDGGTTQSAWQLIGAGLPNTAVVDLKLTTTSHGKALLAATHGRGAWLLSLTGPGTLATPILQTPISGSNQSPSGTTFSWTSVAGATGYRLMVSSAGASLPTDPNVISCPACAINITIPSPNWTSTATLPSNASYTWQVMAYDTGTGNKSPWSAQGTFTVAPTPDTLTFAPAVMNFGNTGLFTSAQQIVQVTNSGSSPATLSSFTLPDTKQFSLTTNCPAVLAAQATCQMSVTFNPQFIGVQQTKLSITNAGNGTTNQLLVLGTSIYATITLDTTQLDFGAQPVGTTSPTRQVNITNPSFIPLVLGIFFNGDFQGSSNCPAQLGGGMTCTITVSFHPAQGGPDPGSISIYDNTPQGQHTVTLLGGGNPLCGKQSSGIAISCVAPLLTQ